MSAQNLFISALAVQIGPFQPVVHPINLRGVESIPNAKEICLVAVRPIRNSGEKGCISVEQRCVETGLSHHAAEKRQPFLMKSCR
jgi:hypothetical protein